MGYRDLPFQSLMSSQMPSKLFKRIVRNSDRTWWMPRLVCVFAGLTAFSIGFVMQGLIFQSVLHVMEQSESSDALINNWVYF